MKHPEWAERLCAHPVEAALQTASRYAFEAEGARAEAPVWLLYGAGRLSAAAGEAGWVYTVQAADDAEFRSGTLRDAVRLGAYTLPLPRGSGEAAEALISRFRAHPSAAAAAAVPASEPRSASAPGLGESSAWRPLSSISEAAPLYVAQTDSKRPLFCWDGKSREAPVLLSVFASSMWLGAAREDAPPWVERLEGDLAPVEGGLRAAGRALKLDAEAVALLLELDKAGPEARVDRLLARGLSTGALDAVVWLDGQRPATARTWAAQAGLAGLCFALGEGERALGALCSPEAEGLEPELAMERFSAAEAGFKRASAAAQDRARGYLRSVLSARPLPAAVGGAALKPEQLFAVALVLRGQTAAAAALLGPPETLRDRQLCLFTGGVGPAQAPAWAALARQLAEAGQLAEASAAISAALSAAPSAEDALCACAWSEALGDPEAADARFSIALAQGVEAEGLAQLCVALLGAPEQGFFAGLGRWLPFGARPAGAPAVERLIGVAELGHPAAAAQLILARDRVEAWPERSEWAARCAALGADQEAAELYERAAAEVEDPALWLKAAEARERAGGDGAALLADLLAYLDEEFLRQEAYARAIELGARLPERRRAWWAHLGAVLGGGGQAASPLAPLPGLDAPTLEALHPGGLGWLERAQQALTDAPAPRREAVVRGLERKEEGPLVDKLAELSAALGISPPECYLYRGESAFGIAAYPLDPPLVLIGVEHLRPGPRALSEAALSFALAVELTHLACGHPVLSFDTDTLSSGRSAYRAFGRYAGAMEALVEVLSLIPGVDQIEKLQRVVRWSRRVLSAKSTVDKVGSLAPWQRWFQERKRAGIGRSGLAGAALQLRLQADRAALLLNPDLGAAAEAILRTDSAAPVPLHGLAELFAGEDGPPSEATLRLSALFSFAVGQLPAEDDRSAGVLWCATCRSPWARRRCGSWSPMSTGGPRVTSRRSGASTRRPPPTASRRSSCHAFGGRRRSRAG